MFWYDQFWKSYDNGSVFESGFNVFDVNAVFKSDGLYASS